MKKEIITLLKTLAPVVITMKISFALLYFLSILISEYTNLTQELSTLIIVLITMFILIIINWKKITGKAASNSIHR